MRSRKRGHSRLVTVLTDNPVYRPLSDLLTVTFGPVPILREALTEVDGVEEAFVYGSWAARYAYQPGLVPGDIDVMVIGQADRDVLYDIAAKAGRTLRREVSIRRMTREVWNQPENEAFRTTVQGRPIVPLIG